MNKFLIIGIIVCSVIGIAGATALIQDEKMDSMEVTQDEKMDSMEVTQTDNMVQPKEYTIGLSEKMGLSQP